MRAAWHVHHNVILEPLTGPIEERRRYIRASKPPEEQALRLRLLRIARGLPRGRLWRAADEAWRALQEAWRAYDEAWRALQEAGRAYQAGHAEQIERLHAEQCPDCPWDGQTIFPGEPA